MAWSDSLVFPPTSNPLWVVVRGAHVEESNPRHVWCVFSPDKTNPATDSMWQSLRSLVGIVGKLGEHYIWRIGEKTRIWRVFFGDTVHDPLTQQSKCYNYEL